MTPKNGKSTPSRPVHARGPGRHGITTIEKPRNTRRTLGRALHFLGPYRALLAFCFVLVIISTLLDLTGPWLIGKAIDTYIATEDLDGLFRIVILLTVVGILLWTSNITQGLIVANISQKAMKDLREKLFSHIQNLPLSYLDRQPHGELMSRLTNDMQNISNLLAQNITTLFSNLLTIIGIIIAMFVLNFWLALASMAIMPAMILMVGTVGTMTRKHYRLYQKQIGSMNADIEEIINGHRVITAFGREGALFERFERINRETRDTGLKAQVLAMLVPPLMGIMSNANIAVLAGLGGWMTLQGTATVGTIAAFYNYSKHFAGPLRHLGFIYNQVQSALAGAERIFDLLDQPLEKEDSLDAVDLQNISGEVTFKNVCFQYVENIPVIKHLDFSAQPGHSVALVGKTGAGKTTIINLLSRFYDVGCGSIKIDGRDIRHIKRSSLRRSLGIVLQNVHLFSVSILENIRYGRPEATDEEVVEAAKIAGAHTFIERLPQSYNTPLTECAGNLSQGQRQLLAIARVILADPAILILDEATSSIDTRTEMHIQAGLLKLMKGRTSIVIAHRLSTIRDADRVVVVDDGCVVESGNHDELIALKGHYHRLYMSQFKGRKI